MGEIDGEDEQHMTRFVIRRFLRGLLTLWVVVTLVFFGLRLSGDPVFALLGSEASPEAYAAMTEKLGLNDPVAVQYVKYMSLVAQGDFGDSIRERRPVTEAVFERVPATLQLAAASVAVAVLVGIPMGIIAARHRNGILDRTLMAFAFFGQSAPNFFVGILLILLFSLWLTILPSAGKGSWQHFIMPTITLSTYGIASLARLTRSSVLEVMNEDYVRTARAKGLLDRTVLGRHILRNAMIPVVTVFGLQLGVAISGAVVTETVFAWPGMGRLAANAVFARDYPIVQFVVLLIAASVVFANFMIDILYGVLDPRITRG